jgi:hypothetical protein
VAPSVGACQMQCTSITEHHRRRLNRPAPARQPGQPARRARPTEWSAVRTHPLTARSAVGRGSSYLNCTSAAARLHGCIFDWVRMPSWPCWSRSPIGGPVIRGDLPRLPLARSAIHLEREEADDHNRRHNPRVPAQRRPQAKQLTLTADNPTDPAMHPAHQPSPIRVNPFPRQLGRGSAQLARSQDQPSHVATQYGGNTWDVQNDPSVQLPGRRRRAPGSS